MNEILLFNDYYDCCYDYLDNITQDSEAAKNKQYMYI